MRKSVIQRQFLVKLFIVVACLSSANGVQATTQGVFENRNDRFRSGANLQETILNAGNVNNINFGKLFSAPVDGLIYAQPLYVAGVSTARGTRNLLLVATMADTVYALDADTGEQIWKRDLKTDTVGAMPIAEALGGGASYGDIDASSDVGVQGTPVIDPAAKIIYFVARTKETTAYVQRLVALNIANGQDVTGSGAAITASVSAGASGTINFDPRIQMQRAGLAIANGQIVICWGSHQDFASFHGWVMTYDKTTLKQTGAFVTTRTALGGGVWQGGRAPAVLANGDVVLFTGNAVPGGSGAGYDGVNNFSESVLVLRPSASGLALVKSFTPQDWATLDAQDEDLGSSGPIVIPTTSGQPAEYIAGGGKDGTVYTINAQTQAAGLLGASGAYLNVGGDQRGGLAFWDMRASGGPLQMYSAAPSQQIGMWSWAGTDFNHTAAGASGVVPGSYPGGVLTLSANGATAGTGILWAVSSDAGDTEHNMRSGVLRAFNAGTLAPLWDSITFSKDDLGLFSKFTPAIVANGKVYVASFSKKVTAFGLLPTPNPTPADYVKIVSRLDPTLVLEVAGASWSDKSRVQIGRDAGWSRQRWKMTTGANGAQFLSALNTGMALDVLAGSMAPETQVDLSASNGSKAQSWKFTQSGNGYTQVISSNAYLALDVQWGMPTDGNTVQTYWVNGSAAQDWTIVPEPDAGLQECSPSVVIKSRTTGKLVTFPAGSTNGAQAVIATQSLSANQTFVRSSNLDGSHSFRSKANGLFLGVAGGSTASGAAVASLTGDGSSAQKWNVNWPDSPNGANGYMQLVPLSSPGLTLDVQWGGSADGTPLQTWDLNGTFAQDWMIYDATSGMQCRFRTPY